MVFGLVQDYVRGLGQIASGKIRFLPEFLRVAAINENRPAAGGMAAIHVAPAVADHPALRKVNAEFARGAQQHARLRLAAIAVGQTLAGMITDFHAVKRQLPAHFSVDGFDQFQLDCAATDIRLVRGDDEQKAGGL